jgi:MFS family permease
MNASYSSTPAPAADSEAIYDRSFWLAYAANLMLVCANSLTFRFAEFIASLEGSRVGTEQISGEVVRAGLIAAIFFRLGLAPMIDRLGPRLVWLVSSVVYVAGGTAFLIPDSLSPWIWIARIAYQAGLAGMFSCSIVHIQNQVPAHRRTEVIGSLGSSGFVGTILGTQLSDLIFAWLPEGSAQFDARFVAMFGGSALLGLAHMGVVFWLTRHDEHRAPHVAPGPFRLLFRYWPGPIVLVAVAMGAGFVVTTVFLTRFATAMHLRGIALFFLPYSLTAFGCRWLFRDWGTSFGRHKMVLWGLAGMTAGNLLFLPVTSDWLFVLPAVVCGFGHSLLFPAVVSIGAGRFPVEYRGSGTTLVLGFTELGTALAAPPLGMLIDRGNVQGGTLGFSWMFVAAAAIAGGVGVFYAVTAARHPDRDPHHDLSETVAGRIVEVESDAGEIIAVPASEPCPPGAQPAPPP